MHSPTGAIDIKDYGMMNHAVDNRSGDNRVAEIIAEFTESNVRCKQRRTFAVTAVYNLEEQGGIF